MMNEEEKNFFFATSLNSPVSRKKVKKNDA